MPQLRKDPIVDRWVIIATERGRRPSDFAHDPVRVDDRSCPFCPGNEHMTPDEVFAVRDGDGAPWSVRVVPNKFPALEIEGGLDREGVGMFDQMNGVGAHEVVIESPDHQAELCEMPAEQIVKVLTTFQHRVEDLRGDPRFRHTVIFRNYGSVAGASLSHPHSQLIALPIMPQLVRAKLQAAREHYAHKERCIFCDLIKQELDFGDRLVAATDYFVTVSPFASRFPFELAVYPRRHCHDIVLATEEETWALAHTLIDILGRMKSTLDNPAYNMIIQTSPSIRPRPGRPDYWGTIEMDYHWHIEIFPRLTKMAGFEWGTGFYINPVAPEEATQHLRNSRRQAVAS